MKGDEIKRLPTMKSIIIFDLDGTLFDTKIGIIDSLNYVLNEYKRNSIKKEDEDLYIGPPVYDSLVKLQGFSEELAQKGVNLYRSIYIEKFIVESRLYPNVLNTLKELKDEGFSLGIATMKTLQQVEKILSIFDMQKLFEEIQTAAEDGTVSKQDMLYNIKHKGLYDKYYMVGDTLGDFKAASYANIPFIAALYGYGFKTTVETSASLKKIAKFEQIKKLIKGE
jgi:phosphoglycolate phosphatase